MAALEAGTGTLLAVFTAAATEGSREYLASEDMVALDMVAPDMVVLDMVASDKALLTILHFLLRLTMATSVVILATNSTPFYPIIIGTASTTPLLEAAIRMDLGSSRARMALTR